MELTEAQERRYARQMILDEIGWDGQERLAAARVLVIGAGGLGAPALLYLGAAGIGTLGVIDDDVVDLSNLQRQVIHDVDHLDRPKVDSAAARLAALNPEIRVERHRARLTAANALDLIRGYDLVLDGSDNFPTRYLVNDACFLAGRTLVAAALLRFDGQIATFKAHAGIGPCYRCLQPEPPPADLIPRCEEAGILGSVAGVMGTLAATEAIKEILGLGESLAGRLMLYDSLGPAFQTIRIPRDPACALCGDAPVLRDLAHHAHAG